MPITSLKVIQKKMKKLERLYNKTPEECAITRCTIEKKMQKLIDRASWLRGKACDINVKDEHKKMEGA